MVGMNESVGNDSDGRWPTAKSDDIVVGATLLTTAIASTLAYLLVIWAVLSLPRLRTSPCYQIMLSLAVCDLFCLLAWMIIAADTMAHGAGSPWWVSISMFVNTIGWRCMGWHQMLLAYNRYVIICRRQTYGLAFGPLRVRLMLLVAWLHSLAFGLPALVPPTITFSLNGYFGCWRHAQIAVFYVIEDAVVTAVLSLVAVVCYALILNQYRNVRRAVFSHNHPMNGNDREFFEQTRLAWQMLALTILYTFNCICFYVVQNAIGMNMWLAFFLSTYTWVLNNGSSPFIYLIFNQSLHRKILDLFQAVSPRITESFRGVNKIVSHKCENTDRVNNTQ